jgi:NTP pyrophosphatase (non-canonical NTP hydrolase)
MKPDTYEVLREKVLSWANDRGILGHYSEQVLAQLDKVQEELDEVRKAYLHFNSERLSHTQRIHAFEELEKEVGDLMVTIINASHNMRVHPVHGLKLAHEKIRFREGRTINGKFVKKEDLIDVDLEGAQDARRPPSPGA